MEWIVKTLVLCFVVGFLISFFDISPTGILHSTWATVQDVVSLVTSAASWAIPYILIGAVVVLPLSVLGLVMRWMKTRNHTHHHGP